MTPATAPSLHDRVVGAIFGTVVADALGVPVEFTGRTLRDYDPVTSMRGHGCWNQPPGTWSDDSSLALVTAEELLNGWHPEAVIRGFLEWLDKGRWTAHGSVFDVGTTTSRAINRFALKWRWDECGDTDEHANGNGSIMRIIPMSLWLAGQAPEEIIRLAGEASALTHAHPRSQLCCALHALVCDGVLRGGDLRTALAEAAGHVRPHVPTGERQPLARLLSGSILDAPRDAVKSQGYVVDTLEASLWCLQHYPTYRECALAAVNLGGDTDTTGAVAGGLAGLREGIAAIPEEWLAALPRRDDLTSLANRFAACIASRV